MAKFTQIISKETQGDLVALGKAGAEALVTSTVGLIVLTCDQSISHKKTRCNNPSFTGELKKLQNSTKRA